MDWLYFADISNNNAPVDVDQIDTDAVICKASEGAGFTDPWRDGPKAHWQPELEQRGIPTSTYHFHRGNASPAAQLACWQRSGLSTGRLRPVIDAEDPSRTIDSASMARSVLALAELVTESEGVEPVIYTGAWWIGQYCTRDKALARYPLWLSAYPLGDTRPPSDAEAAQWAVAGKYCQPPAPWSDVFAWQYTSIARTPGVPGRCDRSVISAANFTELLRSPSKPEDDDMPQQAVFNPPAGHKDAGTFVLGAHGYHDAVRVLDPDHLTRLEQILGPSIELEAAIWDQLVIVEPAGHKV